MVFKYYNAGGRDNGTEKHSLEDINTFVRNAPDFSKKCVKKGISLIKEGSSKSIAKGLSYIALSQLISFDVVSLVVRYSPFIGILALSSFTSHDK